MHSHLTAIIVEDEQLAASRLIKLLIPYEDKIQIIGQASNGQEGLKLIEQLKPDFIFLDIEMPLMNGLEMAVKLSEQPYIIFTTAYDEYALQAFEENSIDYLLKPIQPTRLEKAINKLLDIHGKNQNSSFEASQLKVLIDQLKGPKTIEIIRANVGDKIVILKLQDIQYFKAEDKLTTVVTADGKEYFITPSLTQLLPKLPEHFIQLNRSHIVNENYTIEIRKGFNRKLQFEMQNKVKINVGSSFSAALQDRWKL